MSKETQVGIALLALAGFVFVITSLFIPHGGHMACPFSQNTECTPLLSGTAVALHHLTSVSSLLGGTAVLTLLTIVALATTTFGLVRGPTHLSVWRVLTRASVFPSASQVKIRAWYALFQRAPADVNILRT